MKKITRQTYAIFWQHLRNYKLAAFVVVASASAAWITSVITPLYYKKFVDTLITLPTQNSESLKILTNIILIILLIKGIEWVFFRLGGFIHTHLAYRIMANMANANFEYLHRHSYQFFTNQFVGSIVRKANRLVDAFDRIGELVVWDLLSLGLRISTVLVILFWRNTTIGLILLVWIVFYLIVNFLFVRYKLKYDEEAAAVDSVVTGQLADTITNNSTIKIFAALRSELKRFAALTQRQFRIRRFAGFLDETMFSVQGGVMALLEFVMLFAAIRLWNQGALTVGDFVLIQTFLVLIFHQLFGFGRVIRRMYQHLANAEEMVEILNTPHDIQDKPRAKKLPAPKGAIEFRNVDFMYSKTRPILKGFSLSIAPGEKVGVVGFSGAGKTTLATLILRFFDVTSGQILIDGKNIADVTQDSLREHIAAVPQEPILFHRPLKENIRYGKLNATDKEVMRAAKLAHCHEFINRLPDKYDTYVGERGIKLSGGERQRVAIARAILKNAPILLLDEATSSLDSQAELLIQDALGHLMEGRTTVVIAHRLSTIMKMDRIIVMHEGTIAEEGTHEELLKKKDGTYQKLWNLQAGGFIT